MRGEFWRRLPIGMTLTTGVVLPNSFLTLSSLMKPTSVLIKLASVSSACSSRISTTYFESRIAESLKSLLVALPKVDTSCLLRPTISFRIRFQALKAASRLAAWSGLPYRAWERSRNLLSTGSCSLAFLKSNSSTMEVSHAYVLRSATEGE